MEKKKNTLLHMIMAALFAAMITVATAYIGHIPIGVGGGYLHFGDSLIFLAASLLPMPYAICAAAIGAGLADLLTAPVWAISTIIIKSAMVLSFSSKNQKIINQRNLLAVIPAAVLTIGGYYIAEALIYGNWVSPALSILGNAVQAGGSIAIFVLFGLALDKLKVKSKFF